MAMIVWAVADDTGRHPYDNSLLHIVIKAQFTEKSLAVGYLHAMRRRDGKRTFGLLRGNDATGWSYDNERV